MNKRGQSEIWSTTLLFEVVVGVLIGAILVAAAFNYAAVSEVNKVYVEKDLRLLVPTVGAANGNVEVFYPLISAFKVEIGEEVKMNRDLTINNLFDVSNLIFDKKNNKINVRRVDNE